MKPVRTSPLCLAIALAAGCSEQPPVAEPVIDRPAVLCFLKAHPELSAAVRPAVGERALAVKAQLDAAAQRYGYASFMQYQQAAVRITNAANFLRLAAGADGQLQPPAGMPASDIEAVRMYLDDIERVVREARRRARQAEG